MTFDASTDTGAKAASEAARMPRSSVAVIATLLAATFVVILNETIMNVALPRLMGDLGVSASTVQWLSTGFMLTMAVVIPTTGFLLQRFSTRTVFLLAMGAFCAGTALAASAPGFDVLLLARVVQAVGTATMLPLLITTILTLVPVARRGAVMGNVSIAISVAPALGPTVSGLILQSFSWRFMFIFVLPIAVTALVLGAVFLRNVGAPERQRLDVPSVLLTVPAFGGLVYGLSRIGANDGGTAPVALLALCGGLACLAIFVLRQLRLAKSAAPLLDLAAFQYRMFTVSTLLMVVSMMALFGAVILLPIYLQQVHHLASVTTGLVLLPGGLAMGLLGPVVGRAYDRVGPFPLAVSGSVVMVLCLWQFSQLSAETPVAWIVTVYAALSAGLALLFTPAFTAGLNPLPPHLYPHGSAIMSTVQQLAGAAGTAALVSTYSLASLVSGQAAGIRTAFLVATAIAVGAVVLALLMRKDATPASGT